LRKKLTGEKHSIYNKLLISIVLCTVVTLTASSTLLFVFFNRIALKQVYTSDVKHLTQMSREVISMTESAQSLTFQLYRNSNIMKLTLYEEPIIYDIVAAMAELRNYLSSMPFIESIYVYNPKSPYIYMASVKLNGQNGMLTREELRDQEILTMIDNYTNYSAFTPIARTIASNEGGAGTKGVYTYFCYDALGRKTQVTSAIIVNIDSQWINKDIGSHNNEASGNSFIIDDSGRMLTNNELLPGSSDDEGKVIEHILNDNHSGYFIGQVKGVKSLISYTKADSLGWRYVNITPYTVITKQVESIRQITIYAALGILIVGLFVSWLLSRTLYVPIDRMANRMQMLEVDKRNNLFTIRQQFLRNLIYGREALNSKALRNRFSTIGITIDFQNDYRLALFRIDHFKPFSETRGADLSVYKYAIMNISSELAMQAFEVETVDMDEDSILMILGARKSQADVDEVYLQSMLSQMQKAVQEHLRIDLSITYSPVENQLIHLNRLFKQLKEASLHRMFLGHGCIIRAQGASLPRIREYVFPTDKEKKMVELLMACKTEEAKKSTVKLSMRPIIILFL